MAKIDLWELFFEQLGCFWDWFAGGKAFCSLCKNMFEHSGIDSRKKHIKEHHQPEFLQFKRELAEALGIGELIEIERDCIKSGNVLTPAEQESCCKVLDNLILRFDGHLQSLLDQEEKK